MNRIIKIFTTASLMLLAFACSPDEGSLGVIDVDSNELVEGIAFKIEPDASNPNIVNLTSLMDSRYTPQWDHPQGRSQAQTVTLKIPFAGIYTVKFGVQTRGGMVYGEPVTFTVDQMYAGFISDPMWTMLAGGAGEEKTWYLDLDNDGLSRKFVGPMYFFSNWYTWDALHTASGESYLEADPWDWKKAVSPVEKRVDDKSDGAPVPGEAAWFWAADWKGNQWMTPKADFGTMTFDLKDGANVTVDQDAYGLGLHSGSYLIDTDNKMIKFTDVRPLHDSNRDADAVDWSNVRILYLTEDAMQLGIVPNGTGAMTVYNYISKDYKDNWVPGDVPEPEPPYNGDPSDDLTTTTTTTKTWRAALSGPYNWANLAGNFLNEWTTNSSGTPVFATWEPPYDEAALSKISLKMKKVNATTGTYDVVTSTGIELSGDYTIEANNWIDFGQDITFISGLGGWLNLQTDAGKMRIIRTEKDLAGDISVLHLGRINPSNDSEYMTLALVPSDVGGGDPVIPGTEVAFDNTKLVFGDLETNGKIRLELYNEYGVTKNDPPLNPADIVINERISITFTLGGITLKSGAVGTYKTALSLADADWAPQYWGDGSGPGEATVTGNGKYTIWYEPTAISEGAAVFVIDISGLASDISDLSTVTATINSIKVL